MSASIQTQRRLAEGSISLFTGIDKGGADLIASGDIKVKQGAEPIAFSSTTLVFSDETELPADVVIFAYVVMIKPKSLTDTIALAERDTTKCENTPEKYLVTLTSIARDRSMDLTQRASYREVTDVQAILV